MAMNRNETWLAVIGIALGSLVAVGLGIYSFLHSLETPLHPSPEDVQSVADATPGPAWAGAAEQGRRIAGAGLVEQNLPGLSVAVGVGGDIVWAEGFGWAELDKRLPVTPRTRFRIGHASKTLTSAGVGLLLDQDRLHLGDEIQAHVAAFPRKEWPVTLGQLMGHMAGVRHYRNEADYMTTAHCERASEGLLSFVDDPLQFEPDTQYKYSTYGWILVSAAVEAAAGEPFFSFMRTKVFTPLGMSATTSDSAPEPSPDRTAFYYPRLSGDPSLGAELLETVDYSCFAGAGGFLSTPSDLVRFAMALGSGKLLSAATVRRLQTPQVLVSGEETDYGLGWMLETVTLAGEPTRVAGHASRTPVGGSTSFMTFPDLGLAVVVTSNISFADTRSLALKIAEAFAVQGKGPARQ